MGNNNFTNAGGRETGANTSLAVTREGSLNRGRGGGAGQNNSNLHGQIALRQKNSSQTGMHSNPMSTL